jgi:hypothetical protein
MDTNPAWSQSAEDKFVHGRALAGVFFILELIVVGNFDYDFNDCAVVDICDVDSKGCTRDTNVIFDSVEVALVRLKVLGPDCDGDSHGGWKWTN